MENIMDHNQKKKNVKSIIDVSTSIVVDDNGDYIITGYLYRNEFDKDGRLVKIWKRPVTYRFTVEETGEEKLHLSGCHII